MSSPRTKRDYSDARITEIILQQASRAWGTSPMMLKDSLYSYADRARTKPLIQQLVAGGRLIASYFAGGMGRGRGSTRYFTRREHAVAFAAGLAPIRPAAKPRQQKPSPAASVPATAPTFPRLHDTLDPLGSSRGPGITLLRKPGSNARPIPSLVKPEPTEARITDRTRVTVAPACYDQRYTVHALPPGYRSQLDPRECRAWAQAAVGGRAA